MKKIFLSILLVSFTISFGQNGMVLTARDFADGSTFSGIISSKGAGRSLNYSEIVGSPYPNSNFSLAKIAENYERIPVRYNSYTDQIEFKKDESVMVLPKESKFSRIEIVSPKQTLVLIESDDDLNGYFYELINGSNASLYKKIQTKFIDVIPASNTYSSDKPATFRTQEPVYYIKTEKGFIKKPKNQKDITEQYPDKKDAINSFFKENKIKLQREEDLKKLVSFLNN